ncbi:MAG: DNA-3-methyladenine glycosylase, partial [Saprospiraceae bacterium]
MIVPQEYYLNTDVCFLAKDLLGKLLITNIDNQFCSGIIVETEAYRGPDDIASHSFANRRTLRNNTMYLKGGCSYVYICYGIHHLFNVITAHENVAHAVLIRAIEPVAGIDFMIQRRPEKTLYNN